MDPDRLEQFRQALLSQREALEATLALGVEGTRVVELDQQSVGRLSRMDALQGQAMARATQERRAILARRIASALQRIDEGEYGYCTDCGEEIPLKRLELDPTAPACVSCASG